MASTLWRRADEQVASHAWTWLNALPKGMRPIHLPADFPRIDNVLSRLWSQMATLDLYLRDKEFNPCEDRKGFAPFISKELLAMYVHLLRNRPCSQT